MYHLKFKQSLALSATKPISVNDLLKRLKTLSHELEGIDQETVQRDSLSKVATELVSFNILCHKNKGVTAYASCCIADLLRLCAPDAPFSQAQLKSIFECFAKQLKGLGDVEGTYYPQNYYLLESLATVESIVLIGDIEKGDGLILDVIRTFLDVVKDDQRRKNVEDHMIGIMIQIIQELPHVPAELLEVLLAQFMRVESTKKHAFIRGHAAFEMAKAVFNACADRLQRNVCQYFTDIIFEATQEHPTNEESADDIRLQSAHNLVYELFLSAPSTLQNVIPQIESELHVENIQCRSLATECISLMLASVHGEMLIKQYPSTYKSWAGRRNDKNAAIRTKWIEGIGLILPSSGSALRQGDVEKLCIDGLVTKLVDTDEKVRSAACQVIENLDYDTAKTRLTTGVLRSFSDRCRDKKPSTQEAAFRHIGKLFDWAYDDIAAGDEVAIEKFGPFINHILHCLYVNDPNINLLLEQALFEDVLKSSETDDGTRARRLVLVLSLADDKSRRAFFAIAGQLQKITAQYLSHLLICSDKYNGGVTEEGTSQIKPRLDACVKALTQRFPDPGSAETDLQYFVQRNDRRLYKLMSQCIDPANDYQTVRKSIKDSLKRLGQISPNLSKTFEILLRRASFQVFNRSVVRPIGELSTNPSTALAESAQLLISEISAIQPLIYKSYLIPLASQISNNPLLVPVDNIKALAHFSRTSPKDIPHDSAFFNAMEQLLTAGSPQQAKQAVSITTSMPNGDQTLQRVVNTIVDHLAFGKDRFLANLAVVAQVNLLVPELIEDRANEITSFCAKELLTKFRVQRSETDTEEWSDEAGEECIAKCYAIRILGNRLRAYHATETAVELARPVFKALRSIIVNMGELSKNDETPLHFRSRIRLEAAKMVLKLATLPAYESLIKADDFIQVALFAQDLEFNVRKAFLSRLSKSLSAKALTPRWHAVIFLAAHDPEEHIRSEMKTRAINLASQHRKTPLFNGLELVIDNR